MNKRKWMANIDKKAARNGQRREFFRKLSNSNPISDHVLLDKKGHLHTMDDMKIELWIDYF